MGFQHTGRDDANILFRAIGRIGLRFLDFFNHIHPLHHLAKHGVLAIEMTTAKDRILASQLGEAAIEALLDGQRNVMIGTDNGKIVYVPFAKAVKHDKGINRSMLDLVKILSI